MALSDVWICFLRINRRKGNIIDGCIVLEEKGKMNQGRSYRIV